MHPNSSQVICTSHIANSIRILHSTNLIKYSGCMQVLKTIHLLLHYLHLQTWRAGNENISRDARTLVNTLIRFLSYVLSQGMIFYSMKESDLRGCDNGVSSILSDLARHSHMQIQMKSWHVAFTWQRISQLDYIHGNGSIASAILVIYAKSQQLH